MEEKALWSSELKVKDNQMDYGVSHPVRLINVSQVSVNIALKVMDHPITAQAGNPEGPSQRRPSWSVTMETLR